MDKELITTKQGIFMMILFLFGSAVVVGVGGQAKQDAWLAVIFGLVIAIPILFVYCSLLELFPGQDLFDILISLFGKSIGKIIILLFSWYALHLGALVVRNFTEFIHIVSLTQTPQFVLVMFFGIITIYMVKSGVEVMGRWSEFVLPFILLTIFINIALAAKDFDFVNLKPVLYDGISPLIKPSYGVFSFPFAETILFTAILSSLNKQKNQKKVYLMSILVAGFTLLAATLRNILVLGAEQASVQFFPSFTAVRLIHIGEIIERIEISVATIFLLSGIIKLSVCLLFASKGISKLFDFKDYRTITTPVALLMLTLACIIYKSANEMVEWIKIYPYYASLFQVILPVSIFFYAKIKLSLDSNMTTNK